MSVYVRILLIACVMYEPKWTDAVHRCTYLRRQPPAELGALFCYSPESGLQFYQYIFAIDICFTCICMLLKSFMFFSALQKN